MAHCNTLKKPFITEEGKKVLQQSLESKPRQQRIPPAAHTGFFGQHMGFHSWGAESELGTISEAGSILLTSSSQNLPNPSSCPCPHTPPGHGTLRNSLSAKQQRQLLQKQNKIEYNHEQRVHRAK